MLRNKSTSQKTINPTQTLIAIAIQLALFGGLALSAVFHTMVIFVVAAIVSTAVVVWGACASPERWS
ncbi:MAG TPA: hypothetical protein VFE65_00120 [Pseudonocardia sp.]|jgi:hypothetical protein|nr:hypothetical protein [Pseudonocardia sp.]